MDVAYSVNGAVYEVFARRVSRSQAAALCTARGGQLADWTSEEGKSMVNLLCDSQLGMQCWVANVAASASRCVAVKDSQLTKASCSAKLHVVCQRSGQQQQ